jgi:triosephosphate isomerase
LKIARIILINVCRAVIALTFIFSGYVKAIDPLGTQYKINDYLEAVNLQGMVSDWVTLGMSVGLSALEFTLGVMFFFAISRRVVTKIAAIFMAVMTLITLWLFIAEPINDCGCFGDAVHLTNGETFAKNILLLACCLLAAWKPKDMVRFLSSGNSTIVLDYSIIFIVATSIYSLYLLPQFDFRPYKIGANIKEGMTIPEGAPLPQYETTFIMKKDGVTKEFTLDNYPDSTWEFVDSKTKKIKEGYVPPIHDFYIQTLEGEDITDSIITGKGYTFLLIAPQLENANDANFGQIDQIYEYAEEHDYPFLCLTASGKRAINHWQDITGAEYQFCNTDATTLKTIIRSNPGLILLKDGTVIQKWSHNALPAEEGLNAPLEELSIGTQKTAGKTVKISKILLLFILPIFILSIADRMWAWTKWIKKKRRLTSILTNKFDKPMAKKIVAGNWKMNKNLQEGVALAKELTEVVKDPKCGVIICTPFIHLASVAEIVKGTPIELGAENCADKASGAYTGEVSAEMVKSTGAQYVILGHSERREYYNETPEILKEKVQLALANGLKVIFCIGESLEQREANKQNEVVKAELEGSVFHLSAEEWKNIIIAYEPIWAIGTGKTATAEQAEEIHAYIRSCVADVYGKELAAETTILYGGSCKASNAPELFAKPDIDGGLIGGASLKAADFKGIIDAWG